MKNGKDNTWFWLLIILVVAAQLRFYALDFGRPYTYHPDETKLVAQAGRLLATKFMDKDAYFGIRVYPPFYTYLLAGVMGGYVAVNVALGRFDSLAKVKAAYESDPFQFIMVSRSLVSVLGLALVLLTFMVAKRLYGKRIGLIAALLAATNFVLVRNSHFGTVDIPASFFAMALIWFCANIMERGRVRDYLLAALLLAVVTATKFSMILFVLPIIFAHLSRYEWRHFIKAFLDKKIWLAGLASVLFFLIACPLIWLDFHETWGGIIGTSRFESVGKVGSGGSFLSYWTGDQAPGFGVFYPNSIPAIFGLILTIVAAVALFYLMMRHNKSDLLLLLCIVPLYLMFEKMSIKAMRHILPLIPFLLIAVALAVSEVGNRIKRSSVRIMALLIVVGFFAASQAARALDYHKQLKQVDPRTEATAWIESNVPPNSAIAVESFPPYLPRAEKLAWEVYETDWTSRSMTRRDEFEHFLKKNGNIYYIADDFTRQIFSWKSTQSKYKELTQDRQAFFSWLEANAQKLVTFESENDILQPTIIIYRLDSSIVEQQVD